jgi:hypothetical protein
MRSGLIALVALAAIGFNAAWAQDTTTTPTETAAAAEEAAPAETVAPPETAAAPTESAAEATAPTADAAPPPAPAVTLPGGISAPPAGKGQIVFFRPSRFVGGALSFTVRENEVALGRLPNGKYFVHIAEPGIHEYEIGRNDTMRMDIEDGETYYAVQNTQMGIVAGRAVLAPSDQAAFEAALPRMEVSESDDD